MLRLALDLPRTVGVDVPRRVADALVVVVGHDTGVAQCLDREELDAQPQIQLVALTEDLAQLRERVAVDHARGSMRSSALAACSSRNAATRSATPSSDRARILAARWAAFFAPAEPIATLATGTPGGICTTE